MKALYQSFDMLFQFRVSLIKQSYNKHPLFFTKTVGISKNSSIHRFRDSTKTVTIFNDNWPVRTGIMVYSFQADSRGSNYKFKLILRTTICSSSITPARIHRFISFRIFTATFCVLFD